ncbi:hypothetical protein Droror1_Dr00026387 [Drosera rotundifolia]
MTCEFDGCWWVLECSCYMSQLIFTIGYRSCWMNMISLVNIMLLLLFFVGEHDEHVDLAGWLCCCRDNGGLGDDGDRRLAVTTMEFPCIAYCVFADSVFSTLRTN